MSNSTEGHKQADVTSEVPIQRSINDHRVGRRSSRNSRKRIRHASGNDKSELVQQKLGRISNLNDRVLLRRYELQHDDQNFVACGSLMAESAEKLVGIVDLVLSDDQIDLRRAQLEAIHAQLISDITTFKTKSSYVQDLRHNIAQDEARLKRRVEKLSNLLKLGPIRHDQDVVEEPLPEVESNTSSECSRSDSSTPSLLRQFYDRKGDVGIFEERLTDLEYNYQETLVERDMIRDRGDEVDLTDTQHHEQYLGQRKIILDDLEKAEYEAAQLLQKCRQLGLEIGAHAKNFLVQSTSIDQHPDIADTTLPLPFSEPFRRIGRFENTLPQSVNSSHARVRNWLQTVPQENPEPLRPNTGEIGRRRT